MAMLHGNVDDLTLEEERLAGVTLHQDDLIEPPKYQWSFLGRFVSKTPIDAFSMQNAMANSWKPTLGLWVVKLDPVTFRFDFYHPWERDKVFLDGPWAYEQRLLLMCKFEEGQDWREANFDAFNIWVHVYDLPVGFRSERVIAHIGNFLGRFIESDKNNLTGFNRQYMRLRVTMSVSKPLKRKMQIGKEGESMHWVNFKYERLPTFCFYCGLIGHPDKFCPSLLHHPSPATAVKPYSTMLRAPSRRMLAQQQPVSPWLLTAPPAVTSLPKIVQPTPISEEENNSHVILPDNESRKRQSRGEENGHETDGSMRSMEEDDEGNLFEKSTGLEPKTCLLP